MIKFKEVKTILDDTIKKLNNIIEKMKQYSKIDTDHRATALIDEITKRIDQLNSAYNNVYAHPNFKDVYGENSNYDYTEYVNMLNNDVKRFEEIYQRIKKFESVFGYYAPNPFSNDSGNEPER